MKREEMNSGKQDLTPKRIPKIMVEGDCRMIAVSYFRLKQLRGANRRLVKKIKLIEHFV